jgi:hypothetical protein
MTTQVGEMLYKHAACRLHLPAASTSASAGSSVHGTTFFACVLSAMCCYCCNMVHQPRKQVYITSQRVSSAKVNELDPTIGTSPVARGLRAISGSGIISQVSISSAANTSCWLQGSLKS